MAKKRVSKSRKKSYLKRVSKHKDRRISRRKDKRKIKKTRKKNKRGGALPEGRGQLDEEPSIMRHQQPEPEPELQSEPELQPEPQSRHRPLEDPKQIEKLVFIKLNEKYSSFDPQVLDNVITASVYYSGIYDTSLNYLIRKYESLSPVHGSSLKAVLIDAEYDGILERKMPQLKDEYSMSFETKMIKSSYEEFISVCDKNKQKQRAVEPGNDVILHTVSISKFVYDNMKIGAIQLDVPIVVYRSINTVDPGPYRGTMEMEGFNSTTYYKYYAIKYAIDGLGSIPHVIYADKLLDSGENEVLDYTDKYQDFVLLKITIPAGTMLFHTDVCGKEETELTVLNSGSLNMISESIIDGESDVALGSYIDDLQEALEGDPIVRNLLKSKMGVRIKDLKDPKKRKKYHKNINKKTVKLKQVECNFVPHEEQKNYSEVLFDPLIAELSE